MDRRDLLFVVGNAREHICEHISTDNQCLCSVGKAMESHAGQGAGRAVSLSIG